MAGYNSIGNGFEGDFIESVPKHFKCPICLLTLNQPHLVSCCGKKFCYSCISKVQNGQQVCPICREDFTIFPEKELERHILGLRVRCSNNGCQWEGQLRHLDLHKAEKECPVMRCTECGNNVPHNQKDQHHCTLMCRLIKQELSRERERYELEKSKLTSEILNCNDLLAKMEQDRQQQREEVKQLKDELASERQQRIDALAKLQEHSNNEPVLSELRLLQNEMVSLRSENERLAKQLEELVLERESSGHEASLDGGLSGITQVPQVERNHQNLAKADESVRQEKEQKNEIVEEEEKQQNVEQEIKEKHQKVEEKKKQKVEEEGKQQRVEEEGKQQTVEEEGKQQTVEEEGKFEMFSARVALSQEDGSSGALSQQISTSLALCQFVKREVEKEFGSRLEEVTASAAHSLITEPREMNFNLTTTTPLRLTIQVNNNKGNPLNTMPAFITAELEPVSNSRSSRSKEATTRLGTVKQLTGSSYEVSFEPPFLRGRHTLKLLLNGVDIAGTPLSLFIAHPIKKLGITPAIQDFQNSPWSLSVGGKDKVLLSVDSSIHTYYCGEEEESISVDQIGIICSMTMDDEGCIYVTDNNYFIFKLTANGNFVSKVGGRQGGSSEPHFRIPNGIAFSSKTGHLYVCDSYNRRICILNKQLKYAGEISGCFCNHIAVDQCTGNVFVSHNQVIVFDSNNSKVGEFGGQSFEGLQFSPHDLAVFRSHVFVVELKNRRVSVFNKDTYDYICCFPTKESRILASPCGIAVDGDGYVYVCDSGTVGVLGRAQGRRLLVF